MEVYQDTLTDPYFCFRPDFVDADDSLRAIEDNACQIPCTAMDSLNSDTEEKPAQYTEATEAPHQGPSGGRAKRRKRQSCSDSAK